MILSATGLYEVAAEHDTARALLVARRFKPNVVLLNIDMAESRGGAIALLIVSDTYLRHVPILFVTNPARDEKDRHCPKQSGQTGMLVKPLQAELLLERVARVLAESTD